MFHDHQSFSRERIGAAVAASDLPAPSPPGMTPATTFLAALPIAVYVTDAGGGLTFWNDAAARLWGVSPLSGEPATAQWRIVDGKGHDLPDAAWPLSVTLRSRAAAPPFEGAAVRRDGSVAHFSSSPAPLFDGEGQLIGAIDVLVDLTERRAVEARLRESEEHYRHAVELNPQMPWTADAAGRVLHVNERWTRLTGQTQEAALRDGWTAVANPQDLPDIRRAVAASGLTGDPLDVRFRAMTRDGSERWMRARASARRDADGRITRWYGSTEDIHEAVVAERALRAAEERYRYAGLATRDVFWDHDLRTDRILWSPGLADTFGHVPDEQASAGAFWLGNVHPDDRDRVEASLTDAIATGASRWTAEYRFRRADGSYADVLDCGSLLRDEDGAVIRAIGAMLDFSDRRQAEADLRLSEERLRLALATAGLGIADFDAIHGGEHWSPELRTILGLAPDAPSGVATYLSLVHPEDLPAALEQHRRTRRGDFGHGFRATRRIIRQCDGQVRWISTEGHLLRNDEGRVFRVIMTVRDVTDEKLAQDQVVWAATHDAMTRLPNKLAFQQRLSALLEAGPAEVSSLLMLDLDNFKHVNDTLGHQAGDALLVEVGARLVAALPADALVARFGGDEFAIILPGRSNEAAMAAAHDMLSALDRPCPVDGARSVDVRASIGVASYPRDGADESTLLQAADIALYAAKAGGRCAVRAYASEMRAGLQLRVSAIRQARQALADQAIVPFYQPKVSLCDGTVLGAEALLRWRHPRHGLQEASGLAAAIDDPELGGRIGDAVLASVLGDMRRWLDAGEPVGRVAINASPVQVGTAGFADRLLSSLHHGGVPASLIEVEITETTLMGGRLEQVVRELGQLRDAGVTVALDDFGTGYSSLSHLARFPVDAIKIDRSFIAGLTNTGADRAVVEAVLGLAGALALTPVAEGVETAEQAARLRALGCSVAQGFLFARAIAPGEFSWRATYPVED